MEFLRCARDFSKNLDMISFCFTHRCALALIQSHSAALAHLASKMSGSMEVKMRMMILPRLRGLGNDMIAKLEKEAEKDASEKAYCDEEMGQD